MKKFIALTLFIILVLACVPLVLAEEGSGRIGGTDSDADLKEDIRDIKEDMRDQKENRIDALNIDRVACIKKCEQAGGQNCKERCAFKDKAENVLDRMENKIDFKEDRLEFRSEIRERWEDNRMELKERLRLKDPEKLRRLAALDNAADKLADLSAQEIERFAKLSRENQQELFNVSKAELKEKLRKFNFKQVNSADELKDRIITKEVLGRIKEKFNNANERYEKAKDEYQKAKEEYRKAVSEGDREAALLHAKEVLLKSADAIINHLERLIAKIEENENIDEERAAELIANLQEHIDDVSAIKDEINSATTKEDVREAAKALKEKWLDLRHKAKAFAEQVILARVKGIIHQANILEKKLDRALAHMDEQNITVDVDSQVEEFNTLVADAKSFYEDAQELLSQARESDERDEVKSLVDEAHELLKEAREKLRQAHEVLREIVTKIKQAGQQLDLDDPVEVESEPEDDSDEEDEEEPEESENESEDDDSDEDESEDDDSDQSETDDDESEQEDESEDDDSDGDEANDDDSESLNESNGA